MKSAGKFKSDEVQSIIYEKMPALTNTVEQTMIKNGVDALIYPTMRCVASVRHDAKDSTYKCDSDDPYAASYLASSAHLPEISVPAVVTVRTCQSDSPSPAHKTASEYY